MQEALQRPTSGMVEWLITNFALRRSELQPLLAGQARKTSAPIRHVRDLVKQPFYAGAAVATVAVLVVGWQLGSGAKSDRLSTVAVVVYLAILIWYLTLIATHSTLRESAAPGYTTVEAMSDEATELN
jgi:hypothetical protein